MEQQLERIDSIKHEKPWTDFAAIHPIKAGILGGDDVSGADLLATALSEGWKGGTKRN